MVEVPRAVPVGVANSFLLGGQFLGPLLAGSAMALLDPSLGVLVTGICVASAALLVSVPTIAAGHALGGGSARKQVAVPFGGGVGRAADTPPSDRGGVTLP